MPNRKTPLSSIGRRIKRVLDKKKITQRALAETIGCTQQQIAYLLTAKSVSVEMASRLHSATAGDISKHDLRPDFFGLAPSDEEQAA